MATQCRDSSRWRGPMIRSVIVLLSVAGYPFAFLSLHPRVGDTAFAIGFVPPLIAASLLGMRAGLAVTLAVAAIDVADARSLGLVSTHRPEAAVISFGAKAALVVAVGFLRRLWLRLQAANRALDREVQLRQQVADELKRGVDLYHTLVQSLGEGVAMFDGHDRFMFANAAAERVFCAAPGSLVGRCLLELLDSEGATALKQAATRRSTGPVAYELKTREEGPNSRLLLVTETAVDMPANAEQAVLRVIHDMTERQRLQAEQRQLSEHMQRAHAVQSLAVLAGGVAHDFNNLLTGVLGNAELALLQTRRPDLDDVRHCLMEIQEFAQEAADLSRQMLAYAGKSPVATEAVDVGEVASEALRLVQTTAAARAQIVQEHAADLPPVQGDRMQLRRVLVNLIMNAVEALGERKKTIRISTATRFVAADELPGLAGDPESAPGEYVIVSVRDAGCGMSAELKARIFEPFFSTKVAGRGMGLAATLGIVRAHGGRMSVESSPGEGSTFRVFLPASHEPVSRHSRPSQPSVPIRGTGTILVIDDERAVRSTAARMLGEFGYRAIVAESGQDGLRTLTQEASSVRLVMLDLTMPAMDGKDTLEQLRRANIGVPVLLMSGYQQQEVAGLLGRPGVVGFLQKPIQMEELGRALRGAFCAVPSAP